MSKRSMEWLNLVTALITLGTLAATAWAFWRYQWYAGGFLLGIALLCLLLMHLDREEGA